jgi:hypothetical protein
LAVLHPSRDDCFVAGIECDGISYAAAKNARDRDHLRKSVLEAMGWKIYRVWSPEWITRQDIECQKLLTFINTAIQEFEEIKISETPKATIQTQSEPFTEEIPEISTDETASPIAPAKENSNNPYGFDYYVEAAYNEAVHVTGKNRANRIAEIMHIVSIEQPINIELLYQRMAGAFGRQKVTATVKDSVDDILDTLSQKRQINKDEDGFITITGFNNLKVRIPSPGSQARQINHFSPDEIGLAMIIIASQAIGISSEHLIETTAKALGYARKGERVMRCLNNALERLINQGRIRLVEGKVRVIGGGDRG